jgi:hypothetical protein
MLAFDLGTNEDPVGFDLDGLCTCYKGGAEACVSSVQHCDRGTSGIDNSVSQLVTQLDEDFANGRLAAAATEALTKGRGTILIEVTGYNGEKDDPDVAVYIYPTPGVQPLDDDGDAGANDGGASDAGIRDSGVRDGGIRDSGARDASTADGGLVTLPPNTAGGDTWYRHLRGVTQVSAGGPFVANVILRGHVSNGTLVVTRKEAVPVPFIGALDAQILGTTLVAAVEQDTGGRFVITKGTLSGSWPTEDALRVFSNFEDKGQPVCKGAPLSLLFLKPKVCDGADLRSDGKPTEKCNTLSFAMRIRTVPAKIGNVVDLGPAPKSSCPALTCD